MTEGKAELDGELLAESGYQIEANDI
jgi:hypothetical protein